MWSSVLLPAPLAPTIESISPRSMVRSIPRRIGTSRPSWRNFLVTWTAWTSGWVIGSSRVAQRVDRPQPRPEDRGVDRRDQAHDHRRDPHREELRGLGVDRQAIDVIDLGVERED